MREGWTYKKLGEVCETSSGGTPSKSHMEYYEGGTIPWLRSGEVAQGLIYNTELCITDLGLEKSSAKIFPVNTVVIAMYGATVGQVGLLKKEMATNQAICGILPNSKLFPLFLLYSLKSKKSDFLKDAVGGAQPNISQNLIKKTLIPIPPLAEQERIVAELDLLSSIIEKKKAQLSEYDQLAQSIFYTMFGDPITNEKGWDCSNIDDICISIVRGPFGSALKKEFFIKKNPKAYKVYEQKHAIQKSAQIGEYYISEEKYQELKRFEVFPNDVIMSCSGTIGELFVIPEFAEKGIMNQALLKFTLNYNIIDIYYFLFVMQYVKHSLVVHGSGLQNIGSVSILKNIKLSVPPLSLQQEFAEKIEAIEKQKALVQASIVETETLFNSRMDYYFG